MTQFNLGSRKIGLDYPTYFIADISANHDGDIERAKTLIHLAAESGADAAKFQNFRAAKIVSDRGFSILGTQQAHQASWKKSVFEVYEDPALPWDWTATLKAECDKAGIDYFSTPYDFEAVDMLDNYMEMYKIGSGDITWIEMLRKVAEKGKPVLLATGAADIGDVVRAVQSIYSINPQLLLMQCNTNYTGSLENFKYINLNVLKTYQVMFPDVILGLSDHTPGHTTVLGSVTLGARAIEKHFTDDNNREGPDHAFAMTPQSWREMVDRTRELEQALGQTVKIVEANEIDTVVVQRRCLRVATDLKKGTFLTREMLDVLRPAPKNGIFPYDIDKVIGMKLTIDLFAGDHLRWSMLAE